MRILLILVYVAFALHQSTAFEEHVNDFVVNADLFEKKFYEAFMRYWEENGQTNSNLTDLLQKLNQSNLKLENVPSCLSPKKCLKCRSFAYAVLKYYHSNAEENLDKYFIELCRLVANEPDHVCNGLINVYMTTIKYILRHRLMELSPDQICGILFQYNECSTNKNLIDFTIVSERKPVLTKSKVYEFGAEAGDIASTFTIAHLSDFHYDPQYAAGSSSQCTDFICCRNTSIPKENSIKTAGYWGDYQSCDSPGYLVENICAQLASNHKNIDVIYYTGDFVDHFGWLTTELQLKESITFVTNQIKEKFPNVPIVMVIGNHDIHPSDVFAPNAITNNSVNSKWLYEFVAGLWSSWLPESALTTLRRGGYYSFILRPKLRVIVLNNNLCFTHNLWLLYGSEDMQEQLEWFKNELIAAESNSERVHILAHIPPNTPSCARAWNREYNKLIRIFAHIISGQFNGHTHTDEFTLYYSDDEVAAVNVAWNGGSGTSFIGLNSNYRLYRAESKTYEILDHETWIFNLTDANLTPKLTPKWFKEYSFRDAYNVVDLSPATLSNLVSNVWRNDRNALKKYWIHRTKMSDAKLAEGCDEMCLETARLEVNSTIENNFFQ